MKKKILLLITMLTASFGLFAFSELNVSASTPNEATIITTRDGGDGLTTSKTFTTNSELTFNYYIDSPASWINITSQDMNINENVPTYADPLGGYGFQVTFKNNVYINKGSQSYGDVFKVEVVWDFSDLTSKIIINNDNSKVINASDSDYFTIIMNVPDNKKPAISGQENFVTNVDDAKDLSYFQAFISAIDETDGEVPVYVITDNYTANKSVLGSHKVIWGAKDSSNNEATLEAYIRVVDITKPIITGNSTVVKIGYKETWNINSFKSTLTVTDNYDTLTHSNITVKTDNYTANKAKLGTYNVVFAVKDSSNNEGTFTKPVQVYDNVKPTFSGPVTITTSNNTILTESDVRAQLTAHDEIDGNITLRIELVSDGFSGKGNKVGNYPIKYKVTDNAGNFAEHTVTVQRQDNIPPIIWITDGVSIKTNPTTPLTYEMIIQILQATGQVSTASTTSFTFPYDEYTGNEETPGVYAMTVMARSTSGNENVFNLALTVLDDAGEDGITTNPDFNFGTWIKDNPALFGIGIIAVIGISYLIFKKRK